MDERHPKIFSAAFTFFLTAHDVAGSAIVRDDYRMIDRNVGRALVEIAQRSIPSVL